MLSNSATIILFLITTLIGALLLLKEYKKKQLEYRHRLLGMYSNQGSHSGSGNTHLVTMKIRTDVLYGNIDGFINVKNLADGTELNEIPLNGKLNYNGGTVVLNKFTGGEPEEIGKAEIKISGNHLQWKFVNGNHRFFPKQIFLQKKSS